MTITQMLGQSLTLTLLGLGVVFSFLIILIIFMKLIEKLVKAFKLDKEKTDGNMPAPAQAASQDTAIVAAIAAAVKEKQQ